MPAGILHTTCQYGYTLPECIVDGQLDRATLGKRERDRRRWVEWIRIGTSELYRLGKAGRAESFVASAWAAADDPSADAIGFPFRNVIDAMFEQSPESVSHT